MKFSDKGIIVNIKKYGENSLLIKVFSQNHGVFSGFIKSSKSNKSKTILQLGNMISFEYRARIDDNLGQFYYLDLAKSYLVKIIFNKLKLDLINSIFSIINLAFLERENNYDLFKKIENFLNEIEDDDKSEQEILSNYIKLELKILKTLGYEIDLSNCVVTNSTNDLAFVSPKSARAVCLESGKPYENKLLKLPAFLTDPKALFDSNCLIEGLKLSGFFLEKFLFEDKTKKNQQFFNYRKNIEKSIKATTS